MSAADAIVVTQRRRSATEFGIAAPETSELTCRSVREHAEHAPQTLPASQSSACRGERLEFEGQSLVGHKEPGHRRNESWADSIHRWFRFE